MNERAELPNRRFGLIAPVTFRAQNGTEQTYLVKFTMGEQGRVMEAFICQDGSGITKTGSQARALLEDACKAISRLLQYGDTMTLLADYFGEDREEGAEHGPPSSVIGAIAKVGAMFDAQATQHG